MLTAIFPDDMVWKPFAAFPASVRLAVIVGHPSEPAPYLIRVRVPHGVKLMPHRHPEDRIYTVISGVFYIGLGDEFDADVLVAYPPGAVIVLPGNTSLSLGEVRRIRDAGDGVRATRPRVHRRKGRPTQRHVTANQWRPTMTIIDTALEANRAYAKRHGRRPIQRPAPKIAVVTCMDPRLSNLPDILGLPSADIDVIRTGGPAVTEDVLAELVVSTRVLGSKEIMLLNHTGCGFTTFTDDELNTRLAASTGDASPAPMHFLAFEDPEAHTREQIAIVRAHPWIAKDVAVRGFVFDMETGLLREVHSLVCALHVHDA
jgi:carbonic anhydrase